MESEKIFICKYREYGRFIVMSMILVMCTGSPKLKLHRWNYFVEQSYIVMLNRVCGLSVAALAVLLVARYYYRNQLIRDGKLIWCRIDWTKSKESGLSYIIYANYSQENCFKQYVGDVFLFPSKNKNEEIEKLRKMKMVPVFVSKKDEDRYFMPLLNYYRTYDEVMKKKLYKDVLRAVDYPKV